MGALIMTKGTKRLIAHYNDEFDTWLTFYRNNSAWFDPNTPPAGSNYVTNGHIDIWGLMNWATDPTNAGHASPPNYYCLLPPDSPQHVNLLNRWKYFLQTTLGQPLNDKLAGLILNALRSRTAYAYFLFDVVHDANLDVVGTASTDIDTADPKPIYKITIHTVAMRRAAGPGGIPPRID